LYYAFHEKLNIMQLFVEVIYTISVMEKFQT